MKEDNMIKLFMPDKKGISEKLQRLGRKFNVKVINTKNKSLKNIVNPKTEVKEDAKILMELFIKLTVETAQNHMSEKQEDC